MAGQHPPITRRSVNIDFEPLADGQWAPGGYFEDILNVISYFFPVGEKYFIDSVRYYEDRISDPVLRQQAKDFIFQEAMHSAQHARSNRILDQTRSYGEKIEKISRLLLFKTRWFTPHATQLAITCALEHFTALLSNYLLGRLDSFISLSEPGFGALWAWHAVEETEHKAVCFDVYQHIFGKGLLSYLNRVLAMVIVSLCFLGAVIFGIYFVHKGRRRAEAAAPEQAKRKHRSEAQRKKKSPFRQIWRLIGRSVPARLYFNYYKPSFHPWDHDNAHFIAAWKQAYPDMGLKKQLAPLPPDDLQEEAPVGGS